MAGAHTKHTTSILLLDSASPDPGDAAIVLRALMTLQRASVQWHRSMHDLATCGGCTDSKPTSAPMMPIAVGRFIAATTATSATVRKVVDACEQLRAHVMPFDRVRFGDTLESVDELVARGQVFVVMTCLQHLLEVIPPPSILRQCMDPLPDVLREFPGGIEEVLKCAELEFHRITSLWTQLRRGDERIPDGLISSIASDYQRLHRIAVRAAQREMHALIDHPRFGASLWVGVDHHQPRQVRTASVRIATALQVRLNAELTLPPSCVEVANSGQGLWRSTTPQPVSA